MRLTLHISNREIRLVAFEGDRVAKWGTAPLPAGLVRDGHILQPQAAGAAIASLSRSLKVKGKSAYATLDGLSFTYRLVHLPRLESNQMEEAVRRSAQKEIPLPLEDIYLSWQAIDTGGDEVDVFILGVPRSYLDALAQTMRFAGLKLAGVDLKTLALARAAGQTNALVVDFSPDCFDIVVVADGMPTILHTVLPRGEGTTLEDSVRRLADELARTVNFYNITRAEHPIGPVTPVLLAGALETDETALQLLKSSIEYPVAPLVPPVKYPPGFPLALFASNIGLALKPATRAFVPRGEASRFYDINLNLMAGRRRAEVRRFPSPERILPVAFVVVLALLVPLFFARSLAMVETARLQAQVDRLTRELRLTRLRVDEVAQTEAKIEQLLTEAVTLQREKEQLAGRGMSTANALQTVIDMLGNRGYFTSIGAEPGEIVISGVANNRKDALAYADAIERLAKFGEVRISWLDESGGTTAGIEFTVVITR